MARLFLPGHVSFCWKFYVRSERHRIMMLVPTTQREVAVNNILIEGVDMSPYNEFRLRRLIGGMCATEFGVECRENAKYTTRK